MPRAFADRETNGPAVEPAPSREHGGAPADATSAGRVHRTAADDIRRKRHRRRKWRPGGRSARHNEGRLGPFEYTLLALIALGIGITVAMAILNPSG